MAFEMYKKNSNHIYMTIVINGLGALTVEIKTNHKSNIFSTSGALYPLRLSLSIQVEDVDCVIHQERCPIHVDVIDRLENISDESVIPYVWEGLRERFKFQLIRKNYS